MKALLPTIAAAAILFAAAPASSAQSIPATRERGWEISAGVSGLNLFNTIFLYAFTGLAHSNDSYGADGNEDKPDLDFPGCYNLTARYRFGNRMSIGANLSGQYMSEKIYHTDKNSGEVTYRGRHEFGVVALMPCVRYDYLSKESVTLYGELQAGMAIYMWDCNDPALNLSAQLTPIGVTFGRKLFGFAEIGAGIQWIGGQAGIGYRF